MKVLVTGFNGQLGYDVVKEGAKQGLNIVGIGREELDITIEKDVHEFVEKVKPDAIIHCAAYTAVDLAEEDKETCWKVNVEGTKFLAFAAKKMKAKFLYISTDYVFDGLGQNPFSEIDTPNPVNYYGLTKYEGEKVIGQILKHSFIVRISWVFGTNGKNFIETMLSLSKTRNELNVVGDQYGSPTYTYDLAKILIEMIQTQKYGIYHATNNGYCTWADFANEIFNWKNIDVKVNSIKTEDYPTKAERPKNSRLSQEKLIENGFKPLRSWQEAIQHYFEKVNER